MKPHGVASKDALMRVLKAMPFRRRQVAYLYYLAELKPMEIADFLGISHSAVRSHLQLARQKLREELKFAIPSLP